MVVAKSLRLNFRGVFILISFFRDAGHFIASATDLASALWVSRW